MMTVWFIREFILRMCPLHHSRAPTTTKHGLWGLFWMQPKNLLPCRCASTLRVDRRTVWESTDGLMARRHQLSHLCGAAVMGPMNGMASVRAISFWCKDCCSPSSYMYFNIKASNKPCKTERNQNKIHLEVHSHCWFAESLQFPFHWTFLSPSSSHRFRDPTLPVIMV